MQKILSHYKLEDKLTLESLLMPYLKGFIDSFVSMYIYRCTDVRGREASGISVFRRVDGNRSVG